MCVAKIENFDESKGTPYNYFTKVCQRRVWEEEHREAKIGTRFMTASNLGTDDSDE